MYAKKAESIALKTNDYTKTAILYNRLGVLEKRNNNYTKALSYYEKALKIANQNHLLKIKCDAFSNLSSLYKIRNDRVRSLEELRKGITLSKSNDFKMRLSRNYNALGILLFNTEKDSSVFYYNEALKIAKTINNKYLQGIILSNLGDIYLNIENYSEAVKNLKFSDTIAKEVGDNSSLHFINLSLGIYNEEVNNYPEAVRHYEKAIAKYEDYVDGFQKLRAYWLLSGAYEHIGAYEKGYTYQEKYIHLNDSILNIKKAKEFDEIRTQYEVEKKDTQILLLEKEKELARTRRKGIIISALLLTIPLVILLLFYRHRIKTQKTIRAQENEIHSKEKERLQKEQELVQVKALIEGQDKERNRIAKELHDVSHPPKILYYF